jgi:hypothetical protein
MMISLITSNVTNFLNLAIIDKQLTHCPLLKENRLDDMTIWDEIKEDQKGSLEGPYPL